MTADQLPNESAKAFAAFMAYAGQGENRSLRAVAKQFSKSLTIIARWSRRHKWGVRVRAYDKSIRDTEHAAHEKALKEEALKWARRLIALKEERYQAGLLFDAKADEMFKFPHVRQTSKDGKTIIQPAKWTVADAVRMKELALKMKALSMDVSTEKTEMTGPDNGPIITHSTPVVIVLPDNNRDSGGGGLK